MYSELLLVAMVIISISLLAVLLLLTFILLEFVRHFASRSGKVPRERVVRRIPKIGNPWVDSDYEPDDLANPIVDENFNDFWDTPEPGVYYPTEDEMAQAINNASLAAEEARKNPYAGWGIFEDEEGEKTDA